MLCHFSLNRPTSGPIQSQRRNVRLFVCDVSKHPLLEVVETSDKKKVYFYLIDLPPTLKKSISFFIQNIFGLTQHPYMRKHKTPTSTGLLVEGRNYNIGMQ